MNTHSNQSSELVKVCSTIVEKQQNALARLNSKNWRILIAKMHHNWRTRRQLNRLNDSQLKDLGLTSSDVYQEVHKPLWK
ncbi:DUF1127 domain-containing protein [Marinomonas posidonica]|uniref:DUF1127 domain-containing protein n=1 Tax=Marinomonas posidonica TaxID=936476 RepID=UPI003736F65E